MPLPQAQQASSQLESYREEMRVMTDLLTKTEGMPSYLHQLRSLLAQVESFLGKVNVRLSV